MFPTVSETAKCFLLNIVSNINSMIKMCYGSHDVRSATPVRDAYYAPFTSLINYCLSYPSIRISLLLLLVTTRCDVEKYYEHHNP